MDPATTASTPATKDMPIRSAARGLNNLALEISFIDTESTGSLEFEKSSLIDLELMHHYTTAVYFTFPHGKKKPEYFQKQVPRLALRHQFLLHQVLAVSAFHLLHISEEDLPKIYLQQGTYHLTKSLSGIRDAIGLDITLDRGVALFMASSFLLSSTYASRRHLTADPAQDDAIDDLLGMIKLFLGVDVVQKRTLEAISRDVLQEIFGDNMQVLPEIEPWVTEYSNNLESLRNHIAESPLLDDKTRETALNGCQVLLDAVWSPKASERGIIPAVEVRIVYRWPYWIDDDFLQLIRDRNPVGLAVLLFYCVAMRQTETTCWFLFGWASRLASAISERVKGTVWAEQVQWTFDYMHELDRQRGDGNTPGDDISPAATV
ncbi:fungal specific transcription factor domain-containing protein [Sarocladium implicatum]|nr:fungal specific transcription factor domain-containing protein [Sarocladium implicatum]